MVLIFFSIVKKKYNEYQYYNSQEMKVLSSWMSEFLNGYQTNYCKYPKDGKQFVKYLEQDKDFVSLVGFEIPYFIKNKGIEIYTDSINNKIIVINSSKNKDCKSWKHITDLSFFDYFLNESNIVLLKRELTNICDRTNLNLKLFTNENIVENELLKNKIKKQVRMFRIRNSKNKSNVEISSCKILYFNGFLKNRKLQFDLICDPFYGEKNIKLISDSLSYLLTDLVINNNIDNIYIPIKLCEPIESSIFRNR